MPANKELRSGNATGGMQKLPCTVCTAPGLHWHYKEGDKPAHCTDHSTYIRRPTRERVETVQGGSLYDRKEYPTEREIAIANRLDRSLWRMSSDRIATGVSVSGPLFDGMFDDLDDEEVLDPTKAYCTFCGSELQQITSLSEKKAVIRLITDTYVDSAGEVQTQERVTSRIEEHKACPNCVLKIRKPIVVRTV